MGAAERLFPGIGQRQSREPIQGHLLGTRKQGQKGQVPSQRVPLGQMPEPFGAASEQIPAREADKAELPHRRFHPAWLRDAGFGIHLPPPVISRNQAG